MDSNVQGKNNKKLCKYTAGHFDYCINIEQANIECNMSPVLCSASKERFRSFPWEQMICKCLWVASVILFFGQKADVSSFRCIPLY